MKIVILDGYCENPGDLSWDGLKEYGEIEYYDRTPIHLCAQRIGDASVVITNKTAITKEIMNQCPQLCYIGVLATGYDIIDIEEAKKRNIAVCNVPGYGTNTVSQYAISLLLEICGRVGHHAKEVQTGRWQTEKDWCFWDYPLIELAGKTMGIIGFGRIGQASAKIAKSLGMNVIYHDPHISIKEYEACSQDVLLEKSDVIVLHCPLTSENEQFINKQTISKMKKTAILINNARGKLINENDLAFALKNGDLYAAGLDVSYDEPIANDSPLLSLDNCLITPHISWATKEARERIMDCTVLNLKSFLDGEKKNRIV